MKIFIKIGYMMKIVMQPNYLTFQVLKIFYKWMIYRLILIISNY